MWGRALAQLRRRCTTSNGSPLRQAFPIRYDQGMENPMAGMMRLLPPVRGYAVQVRTKRYKTSRTPNKPKPMLGSRRLMPAKSIYNHPKFVVPKGFRKLSRQEVEHEKFKKVLSRAQIRQFAWTNSEEQEARAASASNETPSTPHSGPPEFRRAATRWNDFHKIPTIAKRSEGLPPIKIKKRPKKIKVTTVVNFNGGQLRNPNAKLRKPSMINRRRPAQLPPSEKCSFTEREAWESKKTGPLGKVVYKGRKF